MALQSFNPLTPDPSLSVMLPANWQWSAMLVLQECMCTAESAKALMQLRQRYLAQKAAQERPWQLISDLQQACESGAWSAAPSLRVSVNLEPESDHPEETRGVVALKVGLSSKQTKSTMTVLHLMTAEAYMKVTHCWLTLACN